MTLVGVLFLLRGLSIGLEVTLVNSDQIEREIPSALTMTALLAPLILFILVFFKEYRRKMMNFIKLNPIMCILSTISFIVGIIGGILLADSFSSILYFVNQNTYELRIVRWDLFE